MKAIGKLKDQARKHEQKEDWARAIESYREVLRIGEEQDGELELGLYNKVGDLYVRLGRPDKAVEQYERAAERYADAGLHNNAIALCNKALRLLPNRAELYQRLGRLCAAQGFFGDARRWFLEYAERRSRGGDVEEALSALEEFASLSEDPEIREMLAKQLVSHHRVDEAVDQLRRAYALHVDAGNDVRAEAVRAEVLALDPNADLENIEFDAPLAPDFKSHEDDFTLQVEHGAGINAEYSAPAYAEIDAEEEADEEVVSYAEPMPDDVDTFGLVSIDTPHPPLPDRPNTFEEGQNRTLAEDVTDADEVEALPLLSDEFGDAADELPMLEHSEALDSGLPLIDLDAQLDTSLPVEAARVGFDGVAGTDATSDAARSSAVPDIPTEMDRARSLIAKGDRKSAMAVFDNLRGALADANRYEDALDVVQQMSEYAPDDMRLKQARVEYASHLDDNGRLIEAYLDLATALQSRGVETKAKAVAQRVLELEPDNQRARALLAGDTRGTKKEYVDLSDFLSVEEDEEAETTRFVVAEKPPTGNEARDFAEMLTQFRAKVAENVGAEDASSHYDLGLAFKEMGLIDEAIAEFQTALKAGQERLQVFEELGDCFVQKGQCNIAVKILSRAALLPHTDATEMLGVNYLLGRCYEDLGQVPEAREAYERVLGLDVDFRDVSERVAKL